MASNYVDEANMWTGLSWCRYWSLLGSATGIDDSFFFVSPVCHYSDCNCEKEGVGWGEGWGWEEKNENRIKWNETVEAAGRTDDCAVANSNPSLTPLPPPHPPPRRMISYEFKVESDAYNAASSKSIKPIFDE